MPTSLSELNPSQLARLLQVGRSLVSNLELESVLQEVLAAASDLTDASYAALGILDSDKRELERFLFRGVDEETRQRIGPLPRGQGILGELIRRPQILRLARISEHPRSYGFPAGHPPMTSFLGGPVKIRGEVFGNIYLTDKRSAAEFDEADERLLEVLAEWAAIAIDNARSHERLSERRAELERAVRGLEATVELSREVERETDLERVLELVVKRGRALADARAAVLLLDDGDAMRVAAVAGEADSSRVGAQLPNVGPHLDVLRSGAPQRVAGRALEGLAAAAFAAEAALLVPLRSHAAGFGVLAAFDRISAGPAFAADDELVMASFAAGAAGAIAAARALGDEKLRLVIDASEQERRRWARELHDETLQELGALRVAQESALALDDPTALRGAVTAAAEQVERLITGLQSLITDLRPSALDQLGPRAAVEALIDRVRERYEIDVTGDFDLAYEGGREAARHSPELEATMYRVVQEALTNVGKHAGARHARVALDERDGKVTVTVEDDGKGIGATGRSGGFGLVGMRERVNLLGGELSVGPGPAGGTRVVAVLPVSRRDPG